jgi:hypothetical protein
MEPEKDVFEQWREERAARNSFRKVIDKIFSWWRHDGQYYSTDFTTGIKNIWYWIPVIWKDRNYDHQYIFDILSHKLKAQSAYIGGRNIHENAKRDAEIIMLCVRLIEKVSSEWYIMEYADYHKTKHWFEPCEDRPDYSTWEFKELEENFDDYFAKYPLIHKRVMNGEGVFKLDGTNDKQWIAMNIAHINHDRARKLLFKIMEKHIEVWWD